jgi:hypothetical protein
MSSDDGSIFCDARSTPASELDDDALAVVPRARRPLQHVGRYFVYFVIISSAGFRKNVFPSGSPDGPQLVGWVTSRWEMVSSQTLYGHEVSLRKEE